MGIHRSQAVILRNRDFKETSFIVSMYTREFGKLHGVAKGARRTQKKFTSAFLPFTQNEVVFYERKDADLCIIAQCDLIYNFTKLREDLARLAYASYFVELVDSATAPHDKNARIFELLVSSLRLLEALEEPRALARVFEVKLLDELGFMPQLHKCIHCGAKLEHKIYFSAKCGGILCQRCLKEDLRALPLSKGAVLSLEHIQQTNLPRATRLDFTNKVADELHEILNKFLEYHLDRQLKSQIFLEKMNIA
ncbi:MAG: DNA repair protein RecO [Candidatus Omnitrophota bacterium]